MAARISRSYGQNKVKVYFKVFFSIVYKKKICDSIYEFF